MMTIYRMPPPELKVDLSDFEKAVIIKWIEDGAEYKPDLAFSKPAITVLNNAQALMNPIDNLLP